MLNRQYKLAYMLTQNDTVGYSTQALVVALLNCRHSPHLELCIPMAYQFSPILILQYVLQFDCKKAHLLFITPSLKFSCTVTCF